LPISLLIVGQVKIIEMICILKGGLGRGRHGKAQKRERGWVVKNEILRSAQNDKFGRADSALGFFLSAKQIG
jgi:hypothetical protein